MKTLSMDLRIRILAAYDSGEETRQEIADRFMVSLGMVKKLIQQRKTTGEIAPRHHLAGRKRKITETHRQRIKELVAQKPDVTLEQLRDALGVECSLPAVHYVLKELGLTYKKRRFGPASRIGPM